MWTIYTPKTLKHWQDERNKKRPNKLRDMSYSSCIERLSIHDAPFKMSIYFALICRIHAIQIKI